MSIYAVISLLSGVFCLFFGGFVFLKSPRNRLNQLLFFVCIIASFFGFTEYELRTAESYERAYFWVKMYSAWPILMALMLHFVLAYHSKLKVSRTVYALIYIPALVITIVEITTTTISSGPFMAYWGWSIQYADTIWSYGAVIWIFLILLIGTYLSFRYYLKFAGQEKKQALYIFIGFLVNFIGIMSTDVLTPLFNYRIPELGNSMSFIVLAIFGYAIWKYQLFEIKPESLAGKIVATISDALFFINSEHQIVEVNQSALSMLEYQKDELIGKPVDIILDSQSLEFYSSNILQQKLEVSKSINDVEVCFITKSRKKIPISLSACSIVYEDNESQGIIYLGRDITERKQAVEVITASEAKLKSLNATKDKLFSIIAHDLRNPFHALLCSSELLYNDFENLEREEKRELVSYVNESANNICTLLDNLLTWTRSQQGNIDYRPKKLILEQVIAENLESLKNMANQKGITITTQIEPHTEVFVDYDMFSIILRNLLSNAIKFTPYGGHVIISAVVTGVSDNFVEISVEDDGVGIDSQTLDHLFDFESISKNGTNEEVGTGLGLILSKEFAERMGTTINVKSEVGKGSKFIFSLVHVTEPEFQPVDIHTGTGKK